MPRALIREALAALGIRSLFLGIQDPSFPGDPDSDLGRGTPYSRASERFLEWIADLGFDGVQLGPQGLITEGSASPYEGMIFSRNVLDLAPEPLVEADLLPRSSFEALVRSRPKGALERADHPHTVSAYRWIGDALWPGPEWDERLDSFIQDNRAWLERDALYDALNRSHRAGWWGEWAGPDADLDRHLFGPLEEELPAAQGRIAALRMRHAEAMRRYAFAQLLVYSQHAAFRQRMRTLGLSIYGDLQIGLSSADSWTWQALFLPGYLMGAPPSRTNPEGQPWGYSVLDPLRYGSKEAPGPAVQFVTARMEKMLAEYDGVRIDHPHGWVCPWVYRTDESDPLQAVQNGARLFSSFDGERHPTLIPFAIPRPDQIDPNLPPFADGHVVDLTSEQVDAYARLFDVIVEAADRRGLPRHALVCEVLSTLPYPLQRVLARHDLGRFRVVQKARLDDPHDVYRCENASPEDWAMLGNHDTPPIWRVIETWRARGELPLRAAYLARKLEPDASKRDAFVRRLEADPGLLVNALFADLLACPAQHVYVFFADLFGMYEIYNVPGTVDPANWSLRVPPDYARRYDEGIETLKVLHLPTALAMALRSRGEHAHPELVRRLENSASAAL